MKVKFDVYSQMCVTSDEIQAMKSKIGWFDNYDFILNKKTGVRLLALQKFPNTYTEDFAWLPTEQQIQQMILSLQGTLSLVVEDFNQWFNEDRDFYDSIPNATFDMLFLMYYMERHNRRFWCWGCGFWKDIAYKQQERENRSKARITHYNTKEDVKED